MWGIKTLFILDVEYWDVWVSDYVLSTRVESFPAVALDGEDHNQMDVDQPTKPLQKLPAPPPENPWRGAVSRVGAAAPNAVKTPFRQR